MTYPIITHERWLEIKEELRLEDWQKYQAFTARRYAIYRVRNYLSGGCCPEPENIEVVKELEPLVEELGGVKMFSDKWDLHPRSGKIVRRDKSYEQAHEEYMQRVTPELGSIAAQEAAAKVKAEIDGRERKL